MSNSQVLYASELKLPEGDAALVFDNTTGQFQLVMSVSDPKDQLTNAAFAAFSILHLSRLPYIMPLAGIVGKDQLEATKARKAEEAADAEAGISEGEEVSETPAPDVH
ncbi:MAG: hypothetical protein ACWGQW_17990 [bacterium]